MRHETADVIASTRTVSADGVLNQTCDLRTYQHNYLLIHTYVGMSGEGMRQVVSAADYLLWYGWDLLTISQIDNDLYGLLRKHPAPPVLPSPYTSGDGGELNGHHALSASA